MLDYRFGDERRIVTVSGIKVATIKDSDGIVVFRGKVPKKLYEPALVFNLQLRSGAHGGVEDN